MANMNTKLHRICVYLSNHHSLASYGLVLDTFKMANQITGGDRFKLVKASQDGHPVSHRPSRRRVKIEADHAGFTIEDVFVVGYGLDCAEAYRTLPDIRAYRPDGPDTEEKPG